MSFTDKAIAAGKEPGTEVLEFATVSAKDVLDEVPDILEIAPEDPMFYIERLRLADGMPVILEKRYVVAACCPGLSLTDVQGSLYSVWMQRYQIQIEGADERIRAVNVRGADARALKVRDGAAGLLVSSVGYLTERKPLWSERTLYRGDAYEFHNRFGGIQPAGFTTGKFLETGKARV